ncbi:hypothetical protein PR048_028495 [Dryococelus australis]|uniref:Uncharacterized protein n=1 Tax=Dryococelus australis TaxID=614101 RepID=A0ABQ9GEH4_9NEOP|nr:hypothetical protein PR048_028495 [Dryococelus australis]
MDILHSTTPCLCTSSSPSPRPSGIWPETNPRLISEQNSYPLLMIPCPLGAVLHMLSVATKASHGSPSTLSSALKGMFQMPSISTNTCIKPPLHGLADALMNPWSIPDHFATRHNMVTQVALIVQWGVQEMKSNAQLPSRLDWKRACKSIMRDLHYTVKKLMGRGGIVVRLLASDLSEPSSTPGLVTLNIHMWESCWAMPLVGGFSWGYPVSLALTFRRCSILSSLRPHRLSTPEIGCASRLLVSIGWSIITIQEHLNGVFRDRWVGRGSAHLPAPLDCSPRSPDLSSCDNALWHCGKGMEDLYLLVSKALAHLSFFRHAKVSVTINTPAFVPWLEFLLTCYSYLLPLPPPSNSAAAPSTDVHLSGWMDRQTCPPAKAGVYAWRLDPSHLIDADLRCSPFCVPLF